VSDEPDLRRQLALDRFWDDVVAGGRARDTDSDLDPALAEALRRLQSLDTAPEEDPAFGPRLWEELMQGHAYGGAIPLHPLVPSANGRSNGPTPAWRRLTTAPRREPGRLTRAFSYAATVTLVVVVLAMIFFVYHNQHNAAIPPAHVSATPAAHTWPVGLGGDAARSGSMPGPGPAGQPVLLWKFPPAGASSPGPITDFAVVADGDFYVATQNGTLLALDAKTGQARWQFAGASGGEALDGDGIVMLSATPSGAGYDLIRVRRSDGTVVWRAEQGRIAPDVTPLVADGVGYVPSGDELVAFDPATGRRRWSAKLGAPASRGASVANGLVVVGDQQGTVYGISTAGGDVVWTSRLGAKTVGHPALANGAAYLTAYDGGPSALYALNLADGTLRWHFDSPAAGHFYKPVVDGTTVFATNADGAFYAVDAATGVLRWKFETGTGDAHAPTLVGGVVYFVDGAGVLDAVDASTGVVRWHFALDTGSSFTPVVVDGVVYVGTQLGSVFAIGGSEPPAGLAIASPEASPSAAAAPSGGTPTAQLLWTTPANGPGALNVPGTVNLDPLGRLWVANGPASQYLIYDLDGDLLETWGSAGNGTGQFDFYDGSGYPGDVAFAADGGLYVADTGNRRVQQFGADRSFVRAWGSEGDGSGDGQFKGPNHIAIGPDGTVYVADAARGDVQRFAPDGTFLGKFGSVGTGNGQFVNSPAGLAVAADGTVYVADIGNNRIEAFDAQGTYLRQFGTMGTGDGQLNIPLEVAVDGAGHVFVTEILNHRVEIFAADGTYLWQLGATTIGDGFAEPVGVAVNRSGTCYVSDAGNHNRVQKFKLTGLFPAPTGATPTA
jgi:outer membrane protein assembly factor BamB